VFIEHIVVRNMQEMCFQIESIELSFHLDIINDHTKRGEFILLSICWIPIIYYIKIMDRLAKSPTIYRKR